MINFLSSSLLMSSDDDGMEAIEKELGTEAMTREQQEEKNQLRAEKQVVEKFLLGIPITVLLCYSHFSGSFGPLLVAVCSNVGNKYTNPLLRSSAVLALNKFMCVSHDFWSVQSTLIYSPYAALVRNTSSCCLPSWKGETMPHCEPTS